MITRLDPDLLARLTTTNHDRTTDAEHHDADLARAVRHATWTRRLFYAAVLAVALYGSATGAASTLGLPWWTAVNATLVLELGGVTFLSTADVRRRLGERATAPRLLGAGIAVAAAALNIATHADRLLGGFFALMSMLGFASWWLDVESKRRDRLRARGLLPPPTPRYELAAHWLRHPATTLHARALAKEHPALGLYGSLEAAHHTRDSRRRDAALRRVIHARLRHTIGADLAGIILPTLNLQQIAAHLGASLDYEQLTAQLRADVHAATPAPDSANLLVAASAAQTDTSKQASAPAGQNTASDTPAVLNDVQPSSMDQTAVRPCSDAQTPDPTAQYDDAAGPHASGGHRAVGTAHDDRPQPDVPTAAPCANPAALAHPGRVRVTVLNEPAILGTDGQPVRGVRAKSTELLTFLAVHRHGAEASDILAAVWPHVDEVRAAQRLSTCLSNLRATIRALHAEHDKTCLLDPIVKSGTHYRLSPEMISVDLWDMQDTHTGTALQEDGGRLHSVLNRYPWCSGGPARS